MTNDTIDESKLRELLGKMDPKVGAAARGALVMLGDRLGLYCALAKYGPDRAENFAERTELDLWCSQYFLFRLSPRFQNRVNEKRTLNRIESEIPIFPSLPVAHSGRPPY